MREKKDRHRPQLNKSATLGFVVFALQMTVLAIIRLLMI
jgi:hypothetical protein